MENRVNQWPELYLPNFKFSDTSEDLVYPKWFEGNWLVTSQDIINDSEEPVIYKVNFFKNDSDLVVGNRCLLYTSPSPRDKRQSRMPSSA